MNRSKCLVALALTAGLCAAAPVYAGPQGRDTTYGAVAGAAAGGLLTHSVGGAVVGGVGGALIGNAIGHHDARHHHYYRRHHGYRHY